MTTSPQDFAVIMAPSAYIDIDNTLKFAVIMEPANQTWW